MSTCKEYSVGLDGWLSTLAALIRKSVKTTFHAKKMIREEMFIRAHFADFSVDSLKINLSNKTKTKIEGTKNQKQKNSEKESISKIFLYVFFRSPFEFVQY